MFATYILIGLILNWGSIFVIYGKLMRICRNYSEVYFEAYKKGDEERIGFDMTGYPYWAKAIITQIFWPINVFNTFNCGIRSIRTAEEMIKEINAK